MENDKRIELKIREAYMKILPFQERMAVRHRLMTRLGLSVRAFEGRINHRVMLDLDEAVVWAQELGLEIEDLYEVITTGVER